MISRCCVARPMPNLCQPPVVLSYINGRGTVGRAFLSRCATLPQLSFSNLPGPVASFRSYASRNFFEIMISKAVISSLLLAALANGLVFKRK